MVKKRNELWVLLFTGVVIHMLTMSNLNMAITAMIKQNISQDAATISHCQLDPSWQLTTSEGEYSSSQGIGEFDWSNADRDMLLSSPSWLMGLASLLGGVLSQKVGGKIMFGYANLLCGALNIITPAVAKFGAMWVVLIRVIQGFLGGAGIAISVNYFMTNWVPHNERSKFAATLAGLYFGVGFSNLLNGYILYLFGWRYIFYVSGTVSILWVLVWYAYVHNHPEKHPRVTSNELTKIRMSIRCVPEKSLPVPWIRILTSAPIIVNSLCYFANMWTTFTFMSYIPTYLRTVHGLSYDKLGSYSSLPYILEFLVAISFAALMDFIAKRKHLTVTNTRKFAALTNHIIGGILWGSIVFGGCNTTFVLIMLTMAVAMNGTSVAIYTPNIIDLSPNFSAAIHGIQGFIGSLSGLLSPIIVNYYTTNYNSVDAWNGIFAVSAILNIVTGLLFLIFGLSKIQNWNAERGANDAEVDVELKETIRVEER